MSGLEQWLSFIEKLEQEWQEKDIGKSWIKTCPAEITSMQMIDNAFDVCKYENMTLKLAQLEKQYINQESKKEALMKWKDGANIVTISLVGGTMFIVWLGDQITSRGVGNGSSLIITVGIIANIPNMS